MVGLLVTVAMMSAVACGGDETTDETTEGEGATPTEAIEVSGKYFAHDWDDVCSSYTDVVGGKSIVFKDGDGNVVGTAKTGELIDVLNDVGGTGGPAPEMGAYSSCEEWAGYEVSLPKADFYQAEIDGESVGTISFSDLEGKDFVFKLVSSDKGPG